MNTLQRGSIRCIVFKDEDIWYAAGLEFNIVESADSPDVALANLQSALQGYIESLRKIKGARVSPLNQKADPEYEKLWNDLNSNKPIKTPYEVRYFGITRV